MKMIIPLILCATFLTAQDTPAPVPKIPPATPVEEVLRPPEPGRFKILFQPFRTNSAALSPDGKYLAYSVREGDATSVLVIEIDHPEKVKAAVRVIDDASATPMLATNQRERTPGRINWMRWVTPTRIAVETNRIFARTSGPALTWQSWRGEVLAFDADGGNAKRIASPDDIQEYVDDSSAANSFSVRRDSPTGFNSRVTRPDQSSNDLLFSPATPNTSIPVDGSNPEDGPLPDAGSSQPRTLKDFDLDPKNPEALTLVATGGPRSVGTHSIEFFSLNVLSGKLTSLAYDTQPDTFSALLDRQGRVRLSLPNSQLSNFPFHYDYLGANGRSRPNPLDRTAGLEGFTVSPDNFFGPRAIPLGFDENPDVLYYAANLNRDTYGIYSLNLSTGTKGNVTMENPFYDLIGPPQAGFPETSTLIFDRFTHQLAGVNYENALGTTAWIEPELRTLQTELEKRFPGRSVAITGWDQAKNRFLLSTEGPADPGAFYVYDAPSAKLIEFVRRAPWVDQNHTHLTVPFSYATKDGARISGLVTGPKRPRLKPIPMVVLCPDQPWLRVRSDFQTDVQALADMGFVVVQLNGRGAWGLGLKQRQSLTNGYDLIQIDDIVNTVSSLEKLFHVNPHRVALIGRGHGGFIALRTLQDHPDKFRCAIAIDAPVNLGAWLENQKWSNDDIQPHLTRAWLGDKTRLKAAPLASHPESITKPILMLNYPGLDGEPRRTSYLAARQFAGKVKSQVATAEFADLHTDYMQGLPAARAEVFDRIEQFLNTHVYDYTVKLHDLEIVK